MCINCMNADAGADATLKLYIEPGNHLDFERICSTQASFWVNVLSLERLY